MRLDGIAQEVAEAPNVDAAVVVVQHLDRSNTNLVALREIIADDHWTDLARWGYNAQREVNRRAAIRHLDRVLS